MLALVSDLGKPAVRQKAYVKKQALILRNILYCHGVLCRTAGGGPTVVLVPGGLMLLSTATNSSVETRQPSRTCAMVTIATCVSTAAMQAFGVKGKESLTIWEQIRLTQGRALVRHDL